ncbi:MAG: 1-deoxy-D-xylulose-5-phosphate reductoisomerase, partial [Bacteroidales bacterium]|nr:1-deoxy-D-xylulose-5-phosphate reductoisomerase [Bacteroidales bacterium]
DLFEVELLTANTSADLLVAQALQYDAGCVVIRDASLYDKVADTLQPHGVKAFTGMDSICSLVAGDNVDIVVAAMVGFNGLEPTLAALKAGKTVALANKETLVAAGEIVMDVAARCGARILPVDSEHSAIFQCLQGSHGTPVEKIHLTTSGGPFRTWSRERIASATPAEALRHPQWSMGAKVTVDSATMMNKGLEIIEAHWLFGADAERINVVVHPESVIHSMVEFRDGAVIAQLACPDMRAPIQYALSWPERLPLEGRKLDFTTLGQLTFHAPDREKFPALDIAVEALGRGGNVPCAMNAANEAAVRAFLDGKIRFYDITDVVVECLARVEYIAKPSLEDIFATHEAVYAMAEGLIDKRLRG